MKAYMPVVASILTELRPKTILDAPSGGGWLMELLNFECEVDGVDLFTDPIEGYRNFQQADLDDGLPNDLPLFDAIVSCEGIEHLGNPLLFLKSAREHLVDNGIIVITTPNIWSPSSKLKFLLRGFFPGFPSLAGKTEKGTHMHIMPWSFPWLWLYLKLSGFEEIELHNIEEKTPKHMAEKIFGWPQRVYCNRKAKRADSQELKNYWRDAGSLQSVYGRRLVVSAVVNK